MKWNELAVNRMLLAMIKTPSGIRKRGGALFGIAATTMSSFITTVQNLTMPSVGSVARSGSKF
jgi:hypothetical protein